jgi:hypothetical protein
MRSSAGRAGEQKITQMADENILCKIDKKKCVNISTEQVDFRLKTRTREKNPASSIKIEKLNVSKTRHEVIAGNRILL